MEQQNNLQPIQNEALFRIPYGLYLLSARCDGRDNACIINAAQLVTDQPKCLAVTVNKRNFTHDMIQNTGIFNLSVLTEQTPFSVFEQFGFRSGRDGVDKFTPGEEAQRTQNWLRYLPSVSNAVISCEVVNTLDCGTHTLFLSQVVLAKVLSGQPSATYDYYQKRIKPQPQPKEKKGWVCKVCGYVYEGEELPPDFICPWCKHGAADFERL